MTPIPPDQRAILLSRGRHMARHRYQRGRLERVGKRVKVWKAHWYVYVWEGRAEVRKHRSQVLGECARLKKSEAQAKLEKLIERTTSQVPKPDGAITFADFVDRVWRPANEATWSRNTRMNYESLLRTYLVPQWGERSIEEIHRAEVQIWLSAVAQGKKHATVRSLVALFSTIMNEAEADEFIERSPVHRVKNPAPPQKRQKPVLTLPECRSLLQTLTGIARLVYGLLLLCGLRISEILALRWDDIGEHWLVVDESAEAKQGGPTKTRTPREVPLPAGLRAELLAYRKQAAYSEDRDFLFPDPDGRCYWRQRAHELWIEPARAASGLTNCNPQVTRRTFATRIKPYADPTDIQAMLGHTTVQMTQKHYIQPVSESQISASERLASEMLQ